MENLLKELIDLLTENVLDQMKKQKITNSIRRNSISGPPMMGLTKNRKVKHNIRYED